MRTKPVVSLIAALALAAALPACGEDEPSTGGSTTEQPSREVQQAVDACRQSVENTPQLSEDAKSELQAICEEGDTSDPEQVKDNAGKVCERIVEESVPEGAARDQAIETCKTATE